MGGNHCAVRFLIELHAEIIKPLNSLGSVIYELIKQFGLCGKVTAAECVDIVLCRGIVRLIRSLNTALCHHCICVTDSEFCDNHSACAVIVSLDSCGCTCSAAADNKNINIIVNLVEVDFFIFYSAVCLKKSGKFKRHLFALIRSY